MYSLKVIAPVFSLAVFLFMNFQVSLCSLQERTYLLDGLNLQLDIMFKNRPSVRSVDNPNEFYSVVTSLIEVHNIQKQLEVVTELDQVIASILQATAADSCAWLQSKVTSFLGEKFNCSDSQLQGLKAFIETQLGTNDLKSSLVKLLKENNEPNYKRNLPGWVKYHFDCSNDDDAAIRSKLRVEGYVNVTQCS